MRPSIVGKILLALAVTTLLVGGSLGPALSQDYNRRDLQPQRFRRAHPPARRTFHPVRRPYQPYGYYYASPPVVYAPPPVVYVPPPSPGIHLFFGLPFGHR